MIWTTEWDTPPQKLRARYGDEVLRHAACARLDDDAFRFTREAANALAVIGDWKTLNSLLVGRYSSYKEAVLAEARWTLSEPIDFDVLIGDAFPFGIADWCRRAPKHKKSRAFFTWAFASGHAGFQHGACRGLNEIEEPMPDSVRLADASVLRVAALANKALSSVSAASELLRIAEEEPDPVLRAEAVRGLRTSKLLSVN